MAISRKTLVTAAITRLKAIPNISVYLLDVADTPPTVSIEDPRVLPYVVLQPSAGAPTDQTDQADEVLEHDWTFQLTCVTGIPAVLPQLVDVVTSQFDDWQPINRPDIGRCRQIADIGNALKDKAETPPRFWLPLIYRVSIGDTLPTDPDPGP